jgi:hypothetical protein
MYRLVKQDSQKYLLSGKKNNNTFTILARGTRLLKAFLHLGQ